MFDTMKQFIIDFKTRSDETNKLISQMIIKSQFVESLTSFIVSNAPLETVSNSATILA